MRKPVIFAQMHSHTLTIRVIFACTILDKSSMHIGRTRIPQCLVGYNTDIVLVTLATIWSLTEAEERNQ